jgi:hypothetical protein
MQRFAALDDRAEAGRESGTDTIGSMVAQHPSGATALVDPPTMTPSGPILQPPRPQDLGPTSVGTPAPVAGVTQFSAPSQPTPTPYSAVPELQTRSDAPGSPAPSSAAPGASAGVSASQGGNERAGGAAPAPYAPPATATPGATATAASAANLSAAAPAAQLPAPSAAQLQLPAQPGAMPVTTTSGTGAGAVTRTTLTGNETPYTVDPTMSSGLSSLLERAQAAVGRSLDQPTVWDDSLAGQIVDQEKRGINENYRAQGDSLDAELAGRGLNWSNIAGNRVTDLKTRQAQELSGVDTSIARERANALAAGRAGALSSAQSLIGTQGNIESGIQNAARGERNYMTGLQTQAHDQNLQDTLASHSMTMDNDAAWRAALGLNSSINNAAGAQYGANAAADNAGSRSSCSS